jgi:hypothetical protein
MEDCVPSYDERLLARMGIKDLQCCPPMNCGLVFIQGDLLSGCAQSEFLNTFLDASAEATVNFTEQTFFALAAKRLGYEPWPADQIALFTTDKYWPVWPNYYPHFRGWIARHYVGPVRPLFWRDAVALEVVRRLGRVPDSRKRGSAGGLD